MSRRKKPGREFEIDPLPKYLPEPLRRIQPIRLPDIPEEPVIIPIPEREKEPATVP